MLVEKFAQIETSQFGDEMTSNGEHHIVVLKFGSWFSRQRQMAELSYRLQQVVPYSEIVPGIACTMA